MLSHSFKTLTLLISGLSMVVLTRFASADRELPTDKRQVLRAFVAATQPEPGTPPGFGLLITTDEFRGDFTITNVTFARHPLQTYIDADLEAAKTSNSPNWHLIISPKSGESEPPNVTSIEHVAFSESMTGTLVRQMFPVIGYFKLRPSFGNIVSVHLLKNGYLIASTPPFVIRENATQPSSDSIPHAPR